LTKRQYSSNGPFKGSPKNQREALEQLLLELCGKVEREKTFDWLLVKDPETMPAGIMKDIYIALSHFRGHLEFVKPGRCLRCDLYVPGYNLLIEYDERQHFTIPRAIGLELYPEELQLGFDRNEWIETCRRIRATDPLPVYRDEQRAFYDSIRDILAAENGIGVIRFQHGTQDWALPGSLEVLKHVLEGK